MSDYGQVRYEQVETAATEDENVEQETFAIVVHPPTEVEQVAVVPDNVQQQVE